MILLQFLSVMLLGYLIGSIPFGLLIGRRFGQVDVRQIGSGKTGATNVMRAAGKKAAFVVVALDMFKGIVPVVAAGFIVDHEYLAVGSINFGMLSAQALAALSAMAGHVWPVFLGFKGGRGVATFFGGLVALCPVAAIFGGEVLICGAVLTRYASLGSMSGVVGSYAILVPLTLMNGFPVEYLFYALVGAFLIIVNHRDNIARLLTGQERKLGDKAVKKT